MSEGEIILNQISKGVLMSVGARNFLPIERGVEFSVGPTVRRRVKIQVNAWDLYDISVRSMTGSTETDLLWNTEYEVTNIWNDQLNDLLLFIERRVWGGEV